MKNLERGFLLSTIVLLLSSLWIGPKRYGYTVVDPQVNLHTYVSKGNTYHVVCSISYQLIGQKINMIFWQLKYPIERTVLSTE